MYKGFPGSSAGKESACNARDSSSIPGSGRSVGEGLGYPPVLLGFPDSSASKEYTCNVRDLGLIPGSGDPLQKGKASPLQYSGLDNSMDYSWGRKKLDMTE